jgi:hypothetical protein
LSSILLSPLRSANFTSPGRVFVRLERAGVNFLLRLENALRLPQEKRSDRVARLGFGDGPVRQAEAAEDRFAVGNDSTSLRTDAMLAPML